jgi:hypothetical protein
MAANNPKKNHDAKYAWTKKAIAFYDDWSKQELVAELIKAQKEIMSLQAKIDAHNFEKSTPPPIDHNEFKEHWTIPTKLLFLLKRE